MQTSKLTNRWTVSIVIHTLMSGCAATVAPGDGGTTADGGDCDGDGDGADGAHCGGDDCNDEDAAVHPDAAEECNGKDDDCDGAADPGCPWTLTYGGPADEWGGRLAATPEGGAILAGSFTATVDFDPGAGEDRRVASGESDAFVTRFAPSGEREWTFTFGGPSYDSVGSVIVDAAGAIVLCGQFSGAVDFDPGPSADTWTSADEWGDAFVLKLNADGTLAWTRVFGSSSGTDYAQAVALAPDGALLIAGAFSGTVDFNSGPPVDERTVTGSRALFVMRLLPDGAYGWTTTFGDTSWSDWTSPQDIAVTVQGQVVVVGTFQGTVDFYIGAGTDEHVGAGGNDVFVTFLRAEGAYDGTRTFGGAEDDFALRVVTADDGSSLIVGHFWASADFDPGPGETRRSPAGGVDAYILKLDRWRMFAWVGTFGGEGDDFATDAAVLPDGSIVATGGLSETADMDPGPATSIETAAGGIDAFVTKLSTDGKYRYALPFGGQLSDWAGGIVRTPDGSFIVSGAFRGAADFDPGSGEDTRTSSGGNDTFVTRLSLR